MSEHEEALQKAQEARAKRDAATSKAERQRWARRSRRWSRRARAIQDKITRERHMEPVSEPVVEPTPEPVSAISIDDLVRESRVTGVSESVADQLRLLAEGKITQEQFTERKAAIEAAHLAWAEGSEARGWEASPEERALAEDIVREAKVQQTEAYVGAVLRAEVEGTITHEQSVQLIKEKGVEHLGFMESMEAGETAVPAGLEVVTKYAFVEPEPVSAPPETVVPDAPPEVVGVRPDKEPAIEPIVEVIEAVEVPEVVEPPEVVPDTFEDLYRKYRLGFTEAAPEGSLGEAIGKGLEASEKVFLSVSDPMREVATEMGEYALVLPAEGRALEGLGYYIGATTLKFGVGVFEGATEVVRPKLLEKDISSMVELWVSEEARAEAAGYIAADPVGFLAGMTGQLVGGFAVAKGAGKVLERAGVVDIDLVRVEEIEIDVKASALELTEAGVQFPEVDIRATRVAEKALPYDVGRLLEAEFVDVKGPTKILGVAEDVGITSLEKIGIPGDDVISRLVSKKPIKVKGVLTTEIIDIGSETYRAVEEIVDPVTGRSILVPKERPFLPLKAKELGKALELPEAAPTLGRLELKLGETILDDVLEVTPPPKVDGARVEFEGPWFEKGVESILEKGKRRYDVKGALIDTSKMVEDVIDDIKPIEPGVGDGTPWAFTHRQPGYTEPLRDLPEALAKDVQIVREITEGVAPVVGVVTAPIDVPKLISRPAMRGVSPTQIVSDAERVKPVSAPELVDTMALRVYPPLDSDILKAVKDIGLKVKEVPKIRIKTRDRFDPLGVGDIVSPIHDLIETPIITGKVKIIPDLVDKVKPKPLLDVFETPVEVPVQKPIPVEIPIQEPIEEPIVVTPPIEIPIQEPIVVTPPIEIQEPIQEPIVIIPPVQIIRQEPKQKQPPFFPTIFGPPRRPPPHLRVREPVRRRRRVQPYSPLGWEERKYPVSPIEELIGGRRRRAPRRPSRRGPVDPSSFLLGDAPRTRKPRKKKTKPRKPRTKKGRKKG